MTIEKYAEQRKQKKSGGDELKQRKPKKLVLTACMRKLLIAINSITKIDTKLGYHFAS